jgi:hypothetical protein
MESLHCPAEGCECHSWVASPCVFNGKWYLHLDSTCGHKWRHTIEMSDWPQEENTGPTVQKVPIK